MTQLEPLLLRQGYELVDLHWRFERQGRVLRLFIDLAQNSAGAAVVAPGERDTGGPGGAEPAEVGDLGTLGPGGVEPALSRPQPEAATPGAPEGLSRPRSVSLADCEKISHLVGRYLDAVDWAPGPYTLEVSSPGVRRPLVKEGDFKRFIGQRARVELKEGVGAQSKERVFLGRIEGVSEGNLLVWAQGKRQVFALTNIAKANLDIDVTW